MTIDTTGRQVRSSSKKMRTPKHGQPLTPREIEVLSRMSSLDEPTARIAAMDLGIGASTVQLHMTRIYRKLGVKSLIGAYRTAVELLHIELKEW